MEILAALLACYLVGAAYFTHRASVTVWAIASDRPGIPPWLREELGLFVVVAATAVVLWPGSMILWYTVKGFYVRRGPEMMELIQIGAQEIVEDHRPPVYIPPADVPPPVYIPPADVRVPFTCPNHTESAGYPIFVEDPGFPLIEGPRSILYTHGNAVWVRSVRCSCGQWAHVYEES